MKTLANGKKVISRYYHGKIVTLLPHWMKEVSSLHWESLAWDSKTPDGYIDKQFILISTCSKRIHL